MCKKACRPIYYVHMYEACCNTAQYHTNIKYIKIQWVFKNLGESCEIKSDSQVMIVLLLKEVERNFKWTKMFTNNNKVTINITVCI